MFSFTEYLFNTFPPTVHPRNTTLHINNQTSALTINETQEVTFDCQSFGRPTPNLELIQSGVVVNYTAGGHVSLSEVENSMRYEIRETACNTTGLYACAASNDYEGLQTDSVQLLVNCKILFIFKSYNHEELYCLNIHCFSGSVLFFKPAAFQIVLKVLNINLKWSFLSLTFKALLTLQDAITVEHLYSIQYRLYFLAYNTASMVCRLESKISLQKRSTY